MDFATFPLRCPHCHAWLPQASGGLLPGRCPACGAWLWPPRYARRVAPPPSAPHIAGRPRLGRLWAIGGRPWLPAQGHLLCLEPPEEPPRWQAFPLPAGIQTVQGLAPLPDGGLLLAAEWQGTGPLLHLTPQGNFRPFSDARAPSWAAPLTRNGTAWALDAQGRLWAFDATAGHTRWQRDLSAFFPQARHVAAWLPRHPDLLGLAGGLLLLRLPGGWAVLDAESGEPHLVILPAGAPPPPEVPAWATPDNRAEGYLLPPAWAPGADTAYLTLGPHLLALRLPTREVQAVFQTPRFAHSRTWFYAPPVPLEDDVLVLHNDAQTSTYGLSRITAGGQVRWTYPIRGWHPYLSPLPLGPWVLLPHRKGKAVAVLAAASGQEIAQISLPGQPLAPFRWESERLWALVKSNTHAQLLALEAVLRPEDVAAEPPQRLMTVRQPGKAARVWLLQGAPLQAALALEDAGEREEALELWRRAHRCPRLVDALRARHWEQAWRLALEGKGWETLLLEIFRRWLEQDAARALAALDKSLTPNDLLPDTLAWRHQLHEQIQAASLQGPSLARWKALRPRLLRMPMLTVTLRLEPPTAHFQPKHWNAFRVEVRNAGFGLARQIHLRFSIKENTEAGLQPSTFTVPEELQPGATASIASPLLRIYPAHRGQMLLQIEGSAHNEWEQRLEIPLQEQMLVSENLPRPIQIKFDLTLLNVDMGFSVSPGLKVSLGGG